MVLPYVDKAEISRYVDTEVEAGGYWTYVNTIVIRVVHRCQVCRLLNHATLHISSVSSDGAAAVYCMGLRCYSTDTVTLHHWVDSQREHS